MKILTISQHRGDPTLRCQLQNYKNFSNFFQKMGWQNIKSMVIYNCQEERQQKHKGEKQKMVLAIMCCISIYGLAELLGEIEEWYITTV